MDAHLTLPTAPFRDPRYAPRGLEVEHRADGEIVLVNPRPYSTLFQTMTAALTYWAEKAPRRVWLAERSGQGWRTITFAEADAQVQAIAGGLLAHGVQGPKPLLILAHNGVEHALISYAAMSQGMPIAPVSPQYGLKNANPARLASACEVLQPAAVFTSDAALFAEGLSSPALAGLAVIAAANGRPGDIAFTELLRGPPRRASAKPDDHAKYLLTSGSTGHPKAVICTHANISLNSAQIEACFDDPDPPIMVNSAPWSHSLGANSILHMSAHRGGAVYIDHGQPTAARLARRFETCGRFLQPTRTWCRPAGCCSPKNWRRTEPSPEASSRKSGFFNMAARRWDRRLLTASKGSPSKRSGKRSASPRDMVRPKPGRPLVMFIGPTTSWASSACPFLGRRCGLSRWPASWTSGSRGRKSRKVIWVWRSVPSKPLMTRGSKASRE